MKQSEIPYLKKSTLSMLPIAQAELQKRLNISSQDTSVFVKILLTENIAIREKSKKGRGFLLILNPSLNINEELRKINLKELEPNLKLYPKTTKLKKVKKLNPPKSKTPEVPKEPLRYALLNSLHAFSPCTACIETCDPKSCVTLDSWVRA
jgi:hypothetical protein